MEFAGLLIGALGAGVLFYAERANWSFSFTVAALALIAGSMGFFLKKSQVPTSIFLTVVLACSELSIQRSQTWASNLYSAIPSIGLIAAFALICSAVSCTVGSVLRSFIDAHQG